MESVGSRCKGPGIDRTVGPGPQAKFPLVLCTGTLIRSLAAQRIDRIPSRGPDGLETDRQRCDGEAYDATQSEGGQPKVDAIGEALEPIVHEPPGYGPPDHVRDDDETSELSRKHEGKVGLCCTDDFPDRVRYR